MHKLENKFLSIGVLSKGAELREVVLKESGENYIWDANPEFWAKTSPVLFPHIGGHNDNKFRHNNKEYEGVKHGFARDNVFTLIESSDVNLKFLLKSNEETLSLYPFEFAFYMIYSLEGTKVKITYKVVNIGNEMMYFNLGTHPAFATPLVEGQIEPSDYYLEFEQVEDGKSFLANGNLLVDNKKDIFEGKIFDLTKETFADGLMVFENLKSEYVSLKNKINPKSVKVGIGEFSYLALWNMPGSGFMCIEPWHGVNEFEGFNGEIAEKKGIMKLDVGKSFETDLVFDIK